MFRGSFVALVTPFDSNQEIDFDAYGRLIDFHLENGSDGNRLAEPASAAFSF